MRQFNRSDRLNQQILKDLSQLLDRELSELTSGITTFTAVRLSKDLRLAKVFYSYLGDNENRRIVEEFFEREKKRIRSQIGKGLKMRHIPELMFTFDDTIEKGIRIEELLNEVGNSKQSDE